MGGFKGFWRWSVGPPRKLSYYSTASLGVGVLLRGVSGATLDDEESSTDFTGEKTEGGHLPQALQLCQAEAGKGSVHHRSPLPESEDQDVTAWHLIDLNSIFTFSSPVNYPETILQAYLRS